MSSTLSIGQLSSTFTRKLVESSLSGEDNALREMVGHMSLLEDSFWPVAGPYPGMTRFGECESLFT